MKGWLGLWPAHWALSPRRTGRNATRLFEASGSKIRIVMALLRPRAAGSASKGPAVAFGIATIAWLCICATQVISEVGAPSKFRIAVLAVLILAPIILLKLARIPIYLLAAYTASVPFDDLLNISAQATYSKLLGILTGLALVFSMLAMGRVVRPSRSLIAALLLAVYMGITIFWAVDPSIAAIEYGRYLEPIFLFVVIALYPIAPRDLKTILIAAIGGALLAAAYGVYLFWHGHGMAATRVYLGTSAEHSIDPNEFAAMLLPAIAVTSLMFARARIGLAKFWWLLGLVLLLSGFAVSGSRGGTFGLAAMCIFLLLRSQYRWQLLSMGTAGVLAVLSSPIGQRFLQTDVGTADGRVDVWKVGIASLRDYWLGGAGVGNFNQAYMKYILAVPHQPTHWDRVAHSIFVGAAVELGLIGFIIFIAFWYLQFRELAHIPGGSLGGDLSLALRAGVLGLFVAGASLSIMTSKYTWAAFALIALMRSALSASGVPLAPIWSVPPKKPASAQFSPSK